jgi:phospholipid/cholesterol/gamma-HCH transport system permease protein
VAAVVCLPLLTAAMEASSLLGAYAVAVFHYQVKGSFFASQVMADVRLETFLFGLLRSVVFGLLIVLIAYAQGAEVKRTSDDIGRATTVAVTAASVAVIVTDFVLLFVVSL